MSRIPSISSNHRLEPGFHLPRTSSSVKGSSRFDKKSLNPVTAQPRSRFFITQDEAVGEFHDGQDENHNETMRNQDFNMVKGYHFIADKRVKGILGKLDATVNKLNNAWESCEKTMAKSSSTSLLRPKLSATFALTEATTFGTNQSNTTKASGVNHMLSMTMSDFLNPNVTMKMRQIGQSVDMDPRTNEIKDHLWDHINKGRDYYNTLKEEIRNRTERLKYLKERMDVLNIMADNTSLETRIVNLNEEIRKAERDIEMAEMETDVLHSMIYQRKEDRDLNKKRFTLTFGPYLKLGKELDKNVENILEIERMFGGYMVEMDGLKKATKDNNKLVKKIKRFQKEREDKDHVFEDNVEMERIYMKKQKQFIIKTKKEIELEQQKKKEREEYLEIQKLNDLMTIKKGYEKDFDLLSTVSKKYDVKDEYLIHLDQLRENNEELEKRVMDLSEEISLKRKIDLPTLEAELNELRTSKDPSGGFNEVSRLRKEWLEKCKRNEMIEAKLAKTQMVNTNLMRGVMTIFHNVSAVKDYLNLTKLEEVKLKLDNLGDVLLFCGEVVEILAKNRQEPEGVRSQPLSFVSLSDEE